jgi:hypothetical protein
MAAVSVISKQIRSRGDRPILYLLLDEFQKGVKEQWGQEQWGLPSDFAGSE